MDLCGVERIACQPAGHGHVPGAHGPSRPRSRRYPACQLHWPNPNTAGIRDARRMATTLCAGHVRYGSEAVGRVNCPNHLGALVTKGLPSHAISGRGIRR